MLAQSDLSLRLLGGCGAGVLREVTALATELSEPFRWLAGGELVLNAPEPGCRRPGASEPRTCVDSTSAGSPQWFRHRLSHMKVPADLITAADEIGIPLLEVPLQTPFAAGQADERTVGRPALRAAARRAPSPGSPAPRSVVVHLGPAVELARALAAKVLILAPSGDIIESHPRSLDTKLAR